MFSAPWFVPRGLRAHDLTCYDIGPVRALPERPALRHVHLRGQPAPRYVIAYDSIVYDDML